MEAIVLEEFGGPAALRLRDVPTPVPGPGELRVKILAGAVNHVDIDIRAGRSRLPLPLPLVLGREGAGVVDAIGDGVHDRALGDRVLVLPLQSCGACAHCRQGFDNLCAIPRRPGVTHAGSYAQFTIAAAESVTTLSAAVPFEQGAATVVSYATAWRALSTLAAVQAGETVLVTGAAGGLGTAAVQVATHLGAKVVALVGSAAKAEYALAQGASWTVNHRDENVVERVLEYTDGAGVHAALEHVGGSTLEAALASLRPRGRIVVAGGHAGEIVPVDVVALFRKELRILGCASFTRSEVDAVLELVAAGTLRPQVATTLPLANAGEAHRLLEERAVLGKVVLHPYDGDGS
jgi:NADPH:quinone reductase-like Zn-dependent oxidoreductase